MNQNNNHKFTEEERKLFKDIANHIRTNPKDYKEAGEWLNDYCSESAYWLRQENELNTLKENQAVFSASTYQRRFDDLERRIRERRTPAMYIRFKEAKDFLLNNYGDEEFISKEVAAKVNIITWLITDADAEKTNLHITEFEKWEWEPVNDISRLTRGYAGFLFAQNKDAWMRLVRIAWEKIDTDESKKNKDYKCEQEAIQKPWYKKAWAIIIVTIIILGGIWTVIQIYESETFKSIFLDSKREVQIPTEKDVNKTTTIKKTDKKVEDITLLYLFENDFDNLLRSGEDRILTNEQTGSEITIKSSLHLDFEAQNKFVSFYIPPTPETFYICTHLAEYYKTALKMTKKVEVEGGAIGLQPVHSSELKFSGRIFIYHECSLFEIQKRELFELYQKQGLSLQFRGPEYLFEKKQIENIKEVIAQPELQAYFALTNSNTLTIAGSSAEPIEKFIFDVSTINEGETTAKNVIMKLIHPSSLRIDDSNGQLKQTPFDLTRTVTKIPLGDIHPKTSEAPESSLKLHIATATINILDITSLHPPFDLTGGFPEVAKKFKIEARVSAEDVPEKTTVLYIVIGTPDALKEHEGTIFTIQEGKLVVYRK